jgi:hypothetical protein
MNYQNKSYRLIALTGLFVIAFGWSGCKVEPIPDPNNPGTGGITQNASVSPIPVIRNEELILIYAEVQTQLNHLPDAVVAINRIRTAASLPPYPGLSIKTA